MLFKDTNKLKEYTEFTEINFDSVKLTIRQVESAYLVDILGNELYASLNAAYTAALNETALSTIQQNLLDYCRMLIGAYVTYNYAPKSDVQLSDSGARRAETANLKTAYAYQLTNFREQKLREAELAAEALLRFLDLNKTDYPLWVASSAFASYTSLFIRSGKEFNGLFPTASPYRNYWAWRYKMLEVEEQTIKPALGSLLYNYFKLADKTSATLSLNEQDVLFRLKKAIAYFTVSFAIPFHAVRLDSGGITVISNMSTANNKDMEVRSPANDSQINNLIRSAADGGTTWLKSAVDVIISYPLDFPLYPFVVISPDAAAELCEENPRCRTSETYGGAYGLV